MNVTRYNAKDVTVTVNGTYITQLGEDMVTFEKEEAYFETSTGAQGDVVKNEINNSIHTLSISIQPTSPQKQMLMDIMARQETVAVWVTNKALGERFGGSMASIAEMPSVSRASSAEDMEFTFTVFDGVFENI